MPFEENWRWKKRRKRREGRGKTRRKASTEGERTVESVTPEYE